MGITLSKLEDLRARGILAPRASVLDIGSSNLYDAPAAGIRAFLEQFDAKTDDKVIERLDRGSAYGPNGGLNESFVGELLEMAGLRYLAFDIANGYRTRIIDLNSEKLPRRLRGVFDVVMNFGTTEHVFNQLNAFRVIHDATKVGGYIIHELPSVGFIDHGYFCYTPRFFFDLAGHNEYEVISFAYQGGASGNDMMNIVRDYRSYFPALGNYLESRGEPGDADRPPNFSSYLILRKTKKRDLRLPLEKSTSVVI